MEYLIPNILKERLVSDKDALVAKFGLETYELALKSGLPRGLVHRMVSDTDASAVLVQIEEFLE